MYRISIGINRALSIKQQQMSEPMEMPLVSIVIATHERLDCLRNTIGRIHENVSIRFELIVVGGAGHDRTCEWVLDQPNIRFIHEQQREGATRAYNKGFRAATAKYVMWLNDDSWPLPGSVEAAVRMIERPDLPDLGMVAFYHNENRAWNRLDEIERNGRKYAIYNVRGRPYANFGLLQRALLERLGYLDERFYFCGWDPDLALRVQQAGLEVLGCREALIHHDELHDERKLADLPKADADNALLFEKWMLPERFSYPDPAGPYCKRAASLKL
jgi:GT2 family glycosyltransferase